MTLNRMKRNTSSVSDTPEDLAVLRGLLDTRLAALETALADPNQHETLEQIILDLARVATEEADATARLAYLGAQREGQGAVAAAQAEARDALDAERAAAAAVRAELETARAGAASVRAALDAARAAAASVQGALDAERTAAASVRAALDAEQTGAASARADLDRAHGVLQQERAAAAARERDLVALRQALEQEQAARASVQREIEDARATMETERTAAARLQQQFAQLQATHQSEHKAGAAHERDLAAARHALEQELKREQTANAKLRGELEEARAAGASVQQALEQAQAALQSERGTGAGRDRDLTVAKDALEKELKREQAAHAKLRKEFEAARSASEGDRAKRQTELERSASGAEARAEAAAREHQKVLAELEAVKQAAFAAEAEAKVRHDKLRDAADQQIRSLQLRVSEADQRATAAESDLELLRRDATPRDAREEPSAVAAASAGTAAAPVAGHAKPGSPVRASKRTAMSGEVDIQIDGNASKLIDLSTTGAQILSPGALKPNRLITLILPLADGRVSCKGKIMWSRLEPGRKGGMWYRAGVSFTSADEAAIEQFLSQQTKAKK